MFVNYNSILMMIIEWWKDKYEFNAIRSFFYTLLIHQRKYYNLIQVQTLTLSRHIFNWLKMEKFDKCRSLECETQLVIDFPNLKLPTKWLHRANLVPNLFKSVAWFHYSGRVNIWNGLLETYLRWQLWKLEDPFNSNKSFFWFSQVLQGKVDLKVNLYFF